MKRAAFSFVGILAAIIAPLVLSVNIALAGSYTVSACSPFPMAGPWVEVDSFPAGLTAGNMCGGPAVGPLGGGNVGALYAEDNVQRAGAEIPNGAQAGWTFTAPAGTVVTGVSYYRNLDIAPTSDDLVVGLFQTDGTRLETCQGTFENGYTCSVPNNQAPASFSGLSTSGLFFGVECQLQPAEEHCLSGSPGHQLATADMYSVAVTLNEQSTPTVSSENGPLWEGGVVSGTVPLGFQATDPSGIEGVAVHDGGIIVANATESCDFTQSVPCPQLEPAALNVDTTHMPDGHSELAVSVVDAAGNTTVVTAPPVVVDNNGPSAPTSLTASGTSGSDVVNLAWSDPMNPPQPVTGAFAQLCQATCLPPIALSPAGAGQIPAPRAGAYTVRLWLIDSAGKGGAQNAATTAVTVPPAGTGENPGGQGKHIGSLRVKGVLHGSRLNVTIGVPVGERGAVIIHLNVPHGRRLALAAAHRVRPRGGLAKTTFVLHESLRREPRLILTASAAGAGAGRLTVTLHKSR